jgi:hypothetical protein
MMKSNDANLLLALNASGVALWTLECRHRPDHARGVIATMRMTKTALAA